MPGDLLVFVVLVAVFVIAGVRVGMLVAPRLDRITQPEDEEADDGHH
jgi:hypothetical protein